jgi:hypothetical protein
MAHQQKYYKEVEANGDIWRLEIWQDIPADENGEPTQVLTPVEIGPVLQSLRLVVQGDQADIDTPIVKTSLEMSFVDAPDLEQDRKCGYWEEFYTSSATEYQIKLYKNNVLEWSGYITPDSFAEDLRYRGSISIIARDNLGTLQDITFDVSQEANVDGKVYIWDMVQKAIRISTCVLSFDVWANEMPLAVGIENPKTSASGMLMYQMIDAQAFKEDNWWNALEKALYSVGLALRYVGENKLALLTLRDLPKYGEQYWWDVPVKDVQFLTYGRRELVPGIKDIKETIEYNTELESVKETIDDYVPDQTAQLECANITLAGPSSTWTAGSVPVHGYKKNRKNQYLMPEYSSLLDVSAYAKVAGEDSEEYGQWEDKSIIYFAMNSYLDIRPVQYIRKVHTAEGKIGIKLSIDKPVTLLSDYSGVLNLPISRAREYGADINLDYALIHEDATTQARTYYNAINGTWSASEVNNAYSLGNGLISVDKPNVKTLELKEISVPSIGTLTLEIRRISTTVAVLELRNDCAGIYLRIKDVSIDVALPEDTQVLDKVSLTTEYSDKYSVRIKRSPELGINPTTAPEVAYVPNAITAETKTQYVGAEQWIWPLGRTTLPNTGISLPRLIHQQLLAYHSAPNNLLTGELLDAAGYTPDFRSLWAWNGKKHMLISGSLNILTGRMESATLREFKRYDHMWETWIENEDVAVSKEVNYITFKAHSNKALGVESWGDDVPNWVYTLADQYNEETGTHDFRVMVEENRGRYRMAIFHIDTAVVRISQEGSNIREYGADYGMDYL